MTDDRKHPDVFTAEEALAYMHLDPEKDLHTLDTLRAAGLIDGWMPGKRRLFHRSELDACIATGFNKMRAESHKSRESKIQTGPRLRLTQREAV